MITLRCYLDSSGKLTDDWITLAAVAATEDVWEELDITWQRILSNHTPKGSYIHMKEVYRLEKAFDAKFGWNHLNAFGMVNECLSYVSNIPKDRIRIFYCSVDLRAWQRLRDKTFEIPNPIDLCNEYCSEAVLGWYAFKFPQIMDPKSDAVKYFFDRDEYFFQPFYEKWKREQIISEQPGKWSLWDAVDEVASVEMKLNPGIQLADIVAWSRNRETFTKDGDMAHYLTRILKSVIPSTHVIWNEETLRKHHRPLLYLS